MENVSTVFSYAEYSRKCVNDKNISVEKFRTDIYLDDNLQQIAIKILLQIKET